MSNIADGKELRGCIHDIVKANGIDLETVNAVIDALPEAIAVWLKSGKTDAGGYHAQAVNGFVLNLEKREERPLHGVAEGEVYPEHYQLHVKASEGMLRKLEAIFELPVKN